MNKLKMYLLFKDGEVMDISDNLYAFEEEGIRSLDTMVGGHGQKAELIITGILGNSEFRLTWAGDLDAIHDAELVARIVGCPWCEEGLAIQWDGEGRSEFVCRSCEYRSAKWLSRKDLIAHQLRISEVEPYRPEPMSHEVD